MPKVSVVVPVYNVEKYLDICLDSILNSSFTDIEVLCINDGSTDTSGDILNHYAKFDSRIKVFHRKNFGLSASRNYGIRYSKSKYIMFVDSDDWISPVMIERLYNNIRHFDSDFCFSGITKYDDKTFNTVNWELIPSKDIKKFVTTPVFNEASASPFFLFNSHVVTWNKIYKKSFINSFKFPEGLCFEDNPFYYQCYLKAKKISFDLAPLYFYRVNRGGSIIGDEKKLFDSFKIAHLCERVLKDSGKYEKYKTPFLILKMDRLFFRVVTASETYRPQLFELLKSEFKNVNFLEYDFQLIKESQSYKNIQIVLSNDYEQFKTIFPQRGSNNA